VLYSLTEAVHSMMLRINEAQLRYGSSEIQGCCACARQRPIAGGLMAAALGVVSGGALAGVAACYGYLRLAPPHESEALFGAFGFGLAVAAWGGAIGGWVGVKLVPRLMGRDSKVIRKGPGLPQGR
jgi:hypothetical protein